MLHSILVQLKRLIICILLGLETANTLDWLSNSRIPSTPLFKILSISNLMRGVLIGILSLGLALQVQYLVAGTVFGYVLFHLYLVVWRTNSPARHYYLVLFACSVLLVIALLQQSANLVLFCILVVAILSVPIFYFGLQYNYSSTRETGLLGVTLLSIVSITPIAAALNPDRVPVVFISSLLSLIGIIAVIVYSHPEIYLSEYPFAPSVLPFTVSMIAIDVLSEYVPIAVESVVRTIWVYVYRILYPLASMSIAFLSIVVFETKLRAYFWENGILDLLITQLTFYVMFFSIFFSISVIFASRIDEAILEYARFHLDLFYWLFSFSYVSTHFIMNSPDKWLSPLFVGFTIGIVLFWVMMGLLVNIFAPDKSLEEKSAAVEYWIILRPLYRYPYFVLLSVTVFLVIYQQWDLGSHESKGTPTGNYFDIELSTKIPNVPHIASETPVTTLDTHRSTSLPTELTQQQTDSSPQPIHVGTPFSTTTEQSQYDSSTPPLFVLTLETVDTFSTQPVTEIAISESGANVTAHMTATGTVSSVTIDEEATVVTSDNSKDPNATETPFEFVENCSVSIAVRRAEIRVGPGEDRAIRRYVSYNGQYTANGQYRDDSDVVWYRLEPFESQPVEGDRFWVKAKDTSVNLECDNLPFVEPSELIVRAEQNIRSTIPVGGSRIHEFNGQGGQTVSIEVIADRPAGVGRYIERDSDGFDTYLTLISPSGSVVAENDDIDRGFVTNSRITNVTLPENGVYRVVVSSWQNRSGGSYTLSID